MTLIGDVPTKTEMEQAGLSHRDSTYKHLVDVIARALEDQKK